MPQFSHLHCHSQYSLLDGAASFDAMFKKAEAEGMPALAMTDHGNMFGAMEFVSVAEKYMVKNGDSVSYKVKPIVGCEFYVVEDRHKKSFSKEAKDNRHHQLMLAKDKDGYRNLSRLCSLGFVEGLYSKYPRIDKELIVQYHKGLIATTCCLGAAVPQAIMNKSEEEAEKEFKWWLDLFGDDYYVELQRHSLPEQEQVNAVLLKFAKKYNVKVIATNDSHYLDREDSNPHDILLCINTGELKSTPIWKGDFGDPASKKGYRFGFPNDEFYFKGQKEMEKLFHDVPEALDNTNEIVDKVTPFKLKSDIMLPEYPLPQGFSDNDSYLEFLTNQGAVKRYGVITPEIDERLKFELQVIRQMGFAGYFLIVQDFINKGRDLNVLVGPGRGSAAGSAVAYCIGITNIDPIKYSLLFERFLNPERVSMPDIDVDFDDEGRQRVIEYVVEKYGKNQVAQIITFGTMAAKMSIKDVSRVLDIPIAESNALAKLVPEKPGTKLKDAIADVKELTDYYKGGGQQATILKTAEKLEGSVRNTGIHAAGIIIAPKDLLDCIPVTVAKDADLFVTQFEGKYIESAGMLKMDFLGLKTLTIIRDALKLIKQHRDIELNIDEIPLDDGPTYALYQRGETVATFQFESEGMRMYLKELKPTNIEDLIAMNALYRPGPMDFIPQFIARKHGREKVEYPHALLEGILTNTFGIMVYQEQIMQAAQIMAGYSLGGADLLRRAMGKKDKEKMAKEREKFVKGAGEIHHVPKADAEKVFSIMERFAEYGFNRSHAAAYSVVAYQTAFLKANYPAEYMASVLTHNIGTIEKITFFMDECRRMGVTILGPDVNESQVNFSVTGSGAIRFGLGAIKGVGEQAVHGIIEERERSGPYTSIFDFISRSNLKAINKRNLENLVRAGAFDCFETPHRAQYFAEDGKMSFMDVLVRYGAGVQTAAEASQVSLFGGAGGGAAIPPPRLPDVEQWGEIEKLRYEKEVVGFYLSGHPLDQFKFEMDHLCTCSLDQATEPRYHNTEVKVAGIISKKVVKQSKNGSPFAVISLEDYNSTIEMPFYGRDYEKLPPFAEEGNFVYIRAKVMPRFSQPDVFELKPQSVELLNLQREKQCKGVSMKLLLRNLEADMPERIASIAKEHRGELPLMVDIIDDEDQVAVRMKSNMRVRPDNELLQQLGTMAHKVDLLRGNQQ